MGNKFRRLNKTVIQPTDLIFGSGVDGSATIATSSTVYLTSDKYYTNLTVESGGTLFTNGFRIFVNGTLTNNGVIGFPSSALHNVADGSGTIAGRGTSLNPPSAWGTSNSPLSQSEIFDLDDATSGWLISSSGTVTKFAAGSLGAAGSSGTSVAAGSGGAGNPGTYPGASVGAPGGAGNPGNPGNPATAGTGGAGGLGGGLVIIVARILAGSGSIVSQGRTGSSGNPSTAGSQGNLGNPAPNITASINSGTHPADALAVSHNLNGPTSPVSGRHHTSSHNPQTHNPTHHNEGHYPHQGDSIFVISPHNATPYHNSGNGSHHHPAGGHHSAHNPNTHVYWSNHNATSNANHHPSGNHHGSHPSNGARNFSNHNGTFNPSKNHNAGHGYHHHPSAHHEGNHNSGHGHHPHPSGTHNTSHPANGARNSSNHNANNQHNAGSHYHPSGQDAANIAPWIPGPFGPHFYAVKHSNVNTSNLNPSNLPAGHHTHSASNHPSGTTGTSPHTATHNPPYSGGTGGARGSAGTANPGNTGSSGETGGIIIVSRTISGNAANQVGHSNFSKVIDI